MNMKVSELREYLKVKHGEEFPSKFTKTQLQLRLAELEGEEKMFAKAGKSRTPLRQMEVALNQASKKKSDLQRHVQQELGLTISGNETIDQLKIKGLAKAYELAPPTAEDYVGFGEHAGLTYEEVIRHHPQYVQWAVQTMKEGQCSPKLKRLAKWAEALELQPVEASKAGMGSYMKSEIKSGGSSSSSGGELGGTVSGVSEATNRGSEGHQGHSGSSWQEDRRGREFFRPNGRRCRTFARREPSREFIIWAGWGDGSRWVCKVFGSVYC